MPMGTKIYLPEELEKRLRKTAMEVYGYGRGSISKAGAAAIERWVHEHEILLEGIDIPEDPVEAIRGMLSHVPASGVQLQHEAPRIRTQKRLAKRNVHRRRKHLPRA